MNHGGDAVSRILRRLVKGRSDVQLLDPFDFKVESLKTLGRNVGISEAAAESLIIPVSRESSGGEESAELAFTGGAFCFAVHQKTSIMCGIPCRRLPTE